jgi:site-specific recombinase XerD
MSSEVLNQFCKDLSDKGRSNSTIIAYKKDLEQLDDYLAKSAKKMNLEIADFEMLNQFVTDISKSGEFTLKTVSRKINSIKTFYKYLNDTKLINSNPSTEIKHPKLIKQLPKILSSLEYRALRDVARNNLRLFTIIELLLQTGIRIGELARLTRSDIVLKDGSVNLKIAQFESYPAREIELNETVSVALKNYLDKVAAPPIGDYLFYTKSGRPLLIRNIRSAIDKLSEKAEIKNSTVNDIRNTFIVHQLANGVNLKTLAHYVGHQKTITTARYLEMVPKKPGKELVKIVML